jgi:hypothetical protein
MRAHEFITEVLDISGPAPAIKNIVVPPEIGPPKSPSGVSLSGRTAASPEDVTHAYRNMSPEELAHAQNNGAFLPNPNTKVAKTWDPTHKYWSSGDEQGHFGRDWKNGADVAKVRVPIEKVPNDSPVQYHHAEVFDKETGKWSPVTTPTTAATMKGSSSTTAATKLQQQPGKAIPNMAINQAFIPSHGNSPNARAFQATQDYIKRHMPRI